VMSSFVLSGFVLSGFVLSGFVLSGFVLSTFAALRDSLDPALVRYDVIVHEGIVLRCDCRSETIHFHREKGTYS
jgi:hypothetical protein